MLKMWEGKLTFLWPSIWFWVKMKKKTIEKNIEQNSFHASLVLKLFPPKGMALEMTKKFIFWICMEVLLSEESHKIILP